MNAAQHGDDHGRWRDDPRAARRPRARGCATARLPARRRRAYRLDGVPRRIIAALRGLCTGASRLWPVGRPALARWRRRSRVFLSRFSEGARSRAGASDGDLAGWLDRRRDGGARHRATGEPDPCRRCRHHGPGRDDPRYLPHAGRGEFAPLLRRPGTRCAAGRRCRKGRYAACRKKPGDRHAARLPAALYNPDLSKWLHRIDVPTLLIWGAEDGLVPPAFGEAYRALIPGATLVVLPAAGHAPFDEQKDAFLAAFSEFIGA